MRPDLGKCVIESPRRGSWWRSNKVRHYGKFTRDAEGIDYEGFTRIPTSRRKQSIVGGGYKEFSDKLGPLEGYLRASCGRPWNDVWAEIKHTLGRAGRGVQHIIDAHLPIAIHTYRHKDGHVYADDASYSPPRQVDYAYYYSQLHFYVEPETGILRKTTFVSKPYKAKPVESIALTDHTEYRRINGIWYWQEYREYEITTVRVNSWGSKSYDRETRYTVVAKRQLNKKELKKLRAAKILG